MSNITLQSIFSPIFEAVNACWGWFASLFEGDWYFLILGLIFFFVFARLILVPLFGGRLSPLGSDTAKGKGISDTDLDKMYAAAMSDGLGDGD